MADNQVVIRVTAQDQTKPAFDSAKSAVGGLKSAFGDVAKTAAGFLTANAIGQGFSFLKGQIGSVFAEARESILIGKQTEAVLKSTGGAAGVTAQQVGDLADSLSRVTNFDDEAIQSAENLLLTFTSIGKDVFPQATETVLNMSQALGQDLKSSAIQLGKAMNDPITGSTALRRVGVALTEQQMKQIETFQKSGDLLSAQKIIMKELATEFGGSARATADPLTLLSNAFKNLKESIGLAILPVALSFATLMTTKVVPALSAGITYGQKFGRMMGAALRGDLMKAGALFNELPKPLQALALWLGKNRESILSFLGGMKELANGVLNAVVSFARWTVDVGLADAALEGVKTIAEGVRMAIELLAPVVAKVAQFFKDHKSAAIALGLALGVVAVALFPIPAAILGVILVVGLLRKNWDELKAKTLEVWKAIPGPIKEAMEIIARVVKFAFDEVRNQIETAINVVRDVLRIGAALWKGDWSAAWEGLKDLAGDIVHGLVTDVALKLGFLKFAFDTASDGIKAAMRLAFDVVRSAAMDALNWIIGKLNDVIDRINKVLDVANKVPGVDFGNIPQIPTVGGGAAGGRELPPGKITAFQHGTPFVPDDMLAYLHRGERVLTAAANASGGGNVAYVTVNAYGNQDNEGLVQLLVRRLREELQMDTLAGPRLPVGAFSPRRA